MKKTDNYESPFKFLRSDVTKLEIDNKMLFINPNSELERKFQVDYEILETKENDGIRTGIVAIMFDIAIQKQENVVMKLELVLNGLFSAGTNSVNEDDFKKLLEYNGVTALYGIARGILTSVSAVSFGTEVIRLPLLNIAKLIEEKSK